VPATSSNNTHTNTYNPPRPVEVYTLSESANASIPTDIRSQFHHDENDKVLFFTAPPLDVDTVPEQTQSLGHSLRYLADKARNKEEDEKKRKAREAELEAEATAKMKRIKTEGQGKQQWIFDNKVKTMLKWCEDMDKGTDELYKQMHGGDWKEIRELDLCKLAVKQEEAHEEQKELGKFRKEREEAKQVRITGFRWI
jgi:chromatin structure-remodeling complex subunit RSC1/2